MSFSFSVLYSDLKSQRLDANKIFDDAFKSRLTSEDKKRIVAEMLAEFNDGGKK